MSRLFRSVEGGQLFPHGSVVCIGAFDGLHLGHRALVRHAVSRARALGVAAVAVAFEPLPREYFAQGEPPPRLTLARDKVAMLRELGVDAIGLLRFDARMNSIPTVMVERVESLSVGGAPTYGSDAISGVNNIILRDRFEGAEVEIGYGSTTKSDNDRYSWSAIFGSSFADGRGHFTIAAELDNSDGVDSLSRDFYRNGYSLQTNPTAANIARFQPWRTPGADGRIDGSIPFNTGPADGIPDQVFIRNRRISNMMGQLSANFEEWRPDGMDKDCAWNVGEVRYSIDGSLNVDLFENTGRKAWILMFATPLAVRITQEGSLQEYWESGVVVAGHNLMRATSSSFLTWLENSSGGVHSSDNMAHYAVFSDDVCVEVLSRVVPSLMPADA